MGIGKSIPKDEAELTLEEILNKNKCLFGIKIKVAIKESEGLSLVYTRGIATPCPEIQKDISKNLGDYQ